MAHIHDKIDYASDVFIVNQGAVLLRYHEKYRIWLAPGGHVELDEDPVQAALREAKEETGLDVELLGDTPQQFDDKEQELLLPRFLNRHAVSDTHEHISFIYFATSKTRDLNPAEGEVTDNMRWFTREELSDPQFGVMERIQHHARAALDAAA